MENATKALIIAAAVLVAIIIISITLMVVRQGEQVSNGADLTEAQIIAFNAKFTEYEGSNIPAGRVNGLLDTVIGHNQREKAGTNKHLVNVTGDVTLAVDDNTVDKVDKGYYIVSLEYTNGLVSTINITERE